MQQVTLEPRPLYGIGTVARLTGVKPDTLRVWERRYGLGSSRKSATGRRQYTQSDMEHLQLVAALVNSGTRIGEIAAAERKTLEMLLSARGGPGAAAVPAAKSSVVFVGEGLCDWLEDHQGCLAHVDARFARVGLEEAGPELSGQLEAVDILAVECATLGGSQVAAIKALASALQAKQVMVTYHFCNERWLQEMKDQGIAALSFPPDPGYLAFELGRSGAQNLSNQGQSDLGELVAARPRQFSERELSAARTLQSSLDCECPRHITDLVRALAHFEEYSSSCAIENWHDAAVHSCLYAYTGQARWLMEKALAAVLEQRTAEFAQVLQSQPAGAIGDAA